MLRSQCLWSRCNHEETANIGKHDSNSELLGFWTLPIVRNPKYMKTQRFENRICLRPQAQFPKRCVFFLFRIPDDGQSPQTQ
jgi:hypothetical protein